eukprot:6583585-Pyramimonas_sp.AAC.2
MALTVALAPRVLPLPRLPTPLRRLAWISPGFFHASLRPNSPLCLGMRALSLGITRLILLFFGLSTRSFIGFLLNIV